MQGKVGVAVLGATGMVGQRMLSLLREHPWFEARVLAASARSAGRTYREACAWHLGERSHDIYGDMPVHVTDPEVLTEVMGGPGIALSALDTGAAVELEHRFAEAGWTVISNASAHRMDEDVPLIVPEVNAAHLDMVHRQRWRGAIVTNPNCTSMPLVMSLKPLMDAFGVEAVTMASYQAVSGAGFPGESSWDMIGNVHPHAGNEEEKVAIEPLKMLGWLGPDGRVVEPRLAVSARCVRVPVTDGHLVAVHARLGRDVSPEEAREVMERWDPGLDLPSAPYPILEIASERDRPSPRFDADRGAGMAVTVGRIERCPVMGLKWFALSHNTVRGAAGGAILNAELWFKTFGRATREAL